MDEQTNHKVVKALLVLACFFYLASLFLTAFMPYNDDDPVRGINALLLGCVQTYFGMSIALDGLLHANLSWMFDGLKLAVPWLANPCIFMSVLLLHTGNNKNVCFVTTVLSVVFALSFILSPTAMLGADLKDIEVYVGAGGYLWLFSALILLLTYQIKSIPSKE